MILVADLESNGLKNTITKIHCMHTIEATTEVGRSFNPNNLHEMTPYLNKADALVFHNGIDYDVPVIRMFYPDLREDIKIIDTLVLSRLVYPDLFDFDKRLVREGRLPAYLTGSHGLKAWGYRLGEHKGEYGDRENAWEHYDDEMLEYCVQDVVVTLKLYKVLIRKIAEFGYGEPLIRLEHDIQYWMTQLNEQGFKFDVEKAQALHIDLLSQVGELRFALIEKYGSWYVSNGITVPKRSVRYKDRLKGDIVLGAPYTKIKLIEFNPSSRDHIAKKLMEHGFHPTEFTDSGKPKIDDEILEDCDIPEADLIKRYLVVQKRLSQLAEGKQAWLTAVTDKGFIHPTINPLGAITTRATHSKPNIGQVPAVGKPYGAECRELFTVPDGWVLFGSDASGLELRCLAHYMSKYDLGKYIKEVLDGDVHTTNQLAAGLPDRGAAKRFISMG
jgi:DNA polymerase-1